tara:strand:+ start:1224 stop:2357 length:1134 start_codon:yes stop_codon:yes gene_type:complete
MKVLFLIPSLEKGGIERSLSRVSRGLIEKGNEVILLSNEVSIEGKSYFEESINLIQIDTPFSNKRSLFFQFLNSLFLFFKFKKIINKNNIDIILAAKNFPLAIFLKTFSTNKFKLILREAVDPYVAAKNQRFFITRKIIIFLKKKLYPRADKVIAISEGVRNSLIENFNFPSKKIDVIYNPAADNRILKLSKEKTENYTFDGYTFINIGRLAKQKDQLTLLKAFKITLDKFKCNLIIIGEGTERNNLERYIAENSLEKNVKLLGYQSNPWKYLSKSNLFVLSSIWEGFGNVIVESMALGIPVISSNCKSGPSEILENGRYGQLYNIHDYNKLSELMINEINSNNLYGKISFAKKRSDDFTILKITNNYIKSFESLLT